MRTHQQYHHVVVVVVMLVLTPLDWAINRIVVIILLTCDSYNERGTNIHKQETFCVGRKFRNSSSCDWHKDLHRIY